MLLLIYKCDIPLKLTIAKGLVLWKEMLPWGLKFSYLYIVIGLYVYLGIALFISIFYFCSLLRPLFLFLWLPSLNHLAFYGAKVWWFCQIPNTRRCLILLKLFRNAFHKCCTIGFSKKLSTELFGVLTPRNHHLLMHVKRLYDDEMPE